MVAPSSLLVPCDVYPYVITEFSSQMDSNLYLLCQCEQAIKETVELYMIWYAQMLMWHHCKYQVLSCTPGLTSWVDDHFGYIDPLVLRNQVIRIHNFAPCQYWKKILLEVTTHGIENWFLKKAWASHLWVKIAPGIFNSSPPSATYMHQWSEPSLVQVMACCLFDAKPLPERMIAYCQLDSWEQISVKFESEFYHFHSRRCIWKCCVPKWRPFCPGGDELMASSIGPLASHESTLLQAIQLFLWNAVPTL